MVVCFVFYYKLLIINYLWNVRGFLVDLMNGMGYG
jgi:hypothetical protein